MRGLPEKLPESKGQWSKLFAWLNQLREHVHTLRPAESLNTMTEHTSAGVIRRGTPKAASSSGDDELVWL